MGLAHSLVKDTSAPQVAKLRAPLAPTLSMGAILAGVVLPASTVHREPPALNFALQVHTPLLQLPLLLPAQTAPPITTAP
jgi:hypothetical protein